jgi:signal transduction histidine kinase
MLLIAIGCGMYSVTNLIYSHALLSGTYGEGGLINESWCLVFGCFAWAAHERSWLERHPAVEAPHQMLARERWLEAIIPALLIAIMVTVALVLAPGLSRRALGIAAIVFVLFALILAVRETWIQRESQRLNDELISANRRLSLANAELQTSEQQHRDLNRQLEARVAQRTAELGRAYGELEGFAYAVAHDLKSPLRSINSFAHLLRQHLGEGSTPEIAAHLDRIRKGSLKMAALIDDLLEYSHIERRALSVSSVDLSGAIGAILNECADDIQRRAVDVRLELAPMKLLVDAEGLGLVLRNLIENALKYSRDVAAPVLRIRASRSGGLALLEIADNGIGFDIAYHDQIFRIFQRLHRDDQYPGTGIGLALVRKAVERMHGRVWAHSEPGKGAQFFVQLPLDGED